MTKQMNRLNYLFITLYLMDNHNNITLSDTTVSLFKFMFQF